ncbi:hypothetical protein Tco_0261849 [Tanacetum coccineum]
MKASMSFSVFGTMFGHKTANSWNLLIPSDLIGLFYSNRLGVRIPPGQGIISQGVPVGPVFLLGLLVLAIVAACASRAATTLISTVVKSKKEAKESSKGTEDELKSDKSKKAESSEEKAKGNRKKILCKKRAGK